MKEKMIVFDMDGVTAGLYQVDGWLEYLENENVYTYVNAQPLVDMKELRKILLGLKAIGYTIAVTSWLAKNATTYYDNQVRIAKKNWLDKFDFPYDELHFLKYGTTKADATRYRAEYQILIDDNEQIRNGWNLGATIDGSQNFIEELRKILSKGV